MAKKQFFSVCLNLPNSQSENPLCTKFSESNYDGSGQILTTFEYFWGSENEITGVDSWEFIEKMSFFSIFGYCQGILLWLIMLL